MKTLIVKLGATGDVVRTTTLLRRLAGEITWLTTAGNRVILPGSIQTGATLQVVCWEDRSTIEMESFDLAINLEDDPAPAAWLASVQAKKIYGAFLKAENQMAYTADSSVWFDMSLISVHGRRKADELKLQNRRTYQDMIFEGLGWKFQGEEYMLPETPESNLKGDVAIAAESGPVWPMKKWAYYERLKSALEAEGLRVNFLHKRPTMLEHLSDVRSHRCLVSGDTLPMHLALGSGIPAVALFNCTSPWEIYDYGRLTKLISPLLPNVFYSREYDSRATTAISFEAVLGATLKTLNLAPTSKHG